MSNYDSSKTVDRAHVFDDIPDKKYDEYLKSSFMVYWFRTSFVYKSELAFAGFSMVFSFLEWLLNDSYLISIVLILASFALLLTFLQFYFGSVYNCIPLLKLHGWCTSMLAVFCFMLSICTLLFSDTVYIASPSNRYTIYKMLTCAICFGSLFATFSAASFSRAKEIESVELSHHDHMYRLLRDIFEISKQVQEEGRKMNLKPKDVFSLS